LVPGSFLLGSLPELRSGFLPACERMFREHGETIRLRLGPPGIGRELTMTFTPDGAHRVLAANQANYRKDNVNYGELRYAVGDGLLTSQDESWTRQKRFLQPLFTHRRVAGYVTTFGEETERMVREWHGIDGQVINVHDAMTRMTLRIVCRVLFGHDVDRALPVVQRWFDPISKAVRQRAFSPVRVPHSWPTPVNRTIHDGQRALFAVCDDIIAERRAHGAGEHDMLGMLVSARDDGQALSDEEIRDQVLVFLLAGHETTATALTSAIYRLGRHPEVRERLRAEVDAVGGVPTAEQAAALTYTTMVLKETLRLYPSAATVGRRAVADDEIDGHLITAGSDVLVSPWIVHRHPEHWPDPLRFDPERFTPEREKARHRYAWFPFGGGPRTCIGMYFSMLEGAVALAGLTQHFDFEVPGADEPGYREPRYTSDITLRPESGMPIKISARRVTSGR
jgi:cytochrome P450